MNDRPTELRLNSSSFCACLGTAGVADIPPAPVPARGSLLTSGMAVRHLLLALGSDWADCADCAVCVGPVRLRLLLRQELFVWKRRSELSPAAPTPFGMEPPQLRTPTPTPACRAGEVVREGSEAEQSCDCGVCVLAVMEACT